MKRIALPILLLGAVLFLAQCASVDEKPTTTAKPVSSGGSPTAEFPETEHNLGQIADSREYTHVFRVRNTGNGTLEIKKVLPGWGSTASWDKAISPGEEGKIKIVLSPSNCSGGYKKTIVVTTNDPKNAYKILYLTGHP